MDNKLTVGMEVNVNNRLGVIEGNVVNNDSLLYIVRIAGELRAVTRAAIIMSAVPDADELRIKKADTRKPEVSKLIKAIRPDEESIWIDANCASDVDPDAWFLDYNIDNGDLPRLLRAITLCESCPVRKECLQVGLTDADLNEGIRGGLFPAERIMMRFTSNRRGVVHRSKIKTALELRRRLKEYTHEQLRQGVKLWFTK